METIRQAQGRRATFKRSEDFNRWNLWHDWNVWNVILPNPTTGTTGTTGTSGTVFSEFAIWLRQHVRHWPELNRQRSIDVVYPWWTALRLIDTLRVI